MTITAMQEDTIEFIRVRDQKPAAAVLENTPCPSWCDRCMAPDGQGNDHDGYVGMHMSAAHVVTDTVVATSPDGDSVSIGTATVEIERLDYAIPGAPEYGPVCLRLEAADETMTPEGAIRFANLILAQAAIAIASRDEVNGR